MNLINPAKSCPVTEDHTHINFFPFSDTEC